MTTPMSRPGEPLRDAGGAPRILLLSNMWPGRLDPVFGVFVSRHVRALRDAGASVRVVANDDPRTGGPISLLKYARLAARSIAAAIGGRHDVIVGHFLYPTAAIAAVAARLSRRPYVLVAHGTDVRSIQLDSAIARASRKAVQGAALVVAVSGALETSLRGVAGLAPEVPSVAIDMGVDTAVFAPDTEARPILGIPAEERVVLFAGKLVPVKGLDILLEAFARLHGEGLADRLVVVGDGPARNELELQARRADVAGKVEFTGQLPQRDVARWMSAADVFVLPSRDEGLGLVLLEAMSCGTPCVGTAVGGIPEALPPECGRIVEPGSPGEMARAIAAMLEVGKASLSAACVRHASAHGVDAQAARMLAEIERSVS